MGDALASATTRSVASAYSWSALCQSDLERPLHERRQEACGNAPWREWLSKSTETSGGREGADFMVRI